MLIASWVDARETAHARVRGVEHATEDDVALFKLVLARANTLIDCWRSALELQIAMLADLQADIVRLNARVTEMDFPAPQPWDALHRWAEQALTASWRKV